jgi:hypothetical protein
MAALPAVMLRGACAAPGQRLAPPAAAAAPLVARRAARLPACAALPARLPGAAPAARRLRAPRRACAPACAAAKPAPGGAPPPAPAADLGSNLTFGAAWAGLSAYAILWAPNQTPVRDAYFIEKLVGLGVDDGVALNAVFFCLFNIMGVWPAVYAALLTPSGRSANGVRRGGRGACASALRLQR